MLGSKYSWNTRIILYIIMIIAYFVVYLQSFKALDFKFLPPGMPRTIVETFETPNKK